MFQFSSEFIATLLSKGDAEKQELLSLLQQDESDPKGDEHFQGIVKKRLSERFKSIEKEATKDHKDIYIKARNETVEDYKKDLLKVLPNFKTEAENKEFFREAIKHARENAPEKIVTKEIELTLDNAMQHPIVQQIVQDTVQEKVKLAESTLTGEIMELKEVNNKLITERKTNALRKIVAKEAEAAGIIREGMKQSTINTRVNTLMLVAKQKAKDFEIEYEHGEPVKALPIGDNGKPLADDLMRPRTMSSFLVEDVNDNGNLFTIHEIDPSSQSPKIDNNNNGGRQQRTSTVFKDKPDYIRQRATAIGIEAKKKLDDAWEAQSAQAQ